MIDGADWSNTASNVIHEVREFLGIEAATEVIFNELKSVMTMASASISDRHLLLLTDVMTRHGYLVAINRHGFNRLNCPMARASFEETIENLFEAAGTAEKDPITDIVSNVSVGQTVPAGTGRVHTLVQRSYLHAMERQQKQNNDSSSSDAMAKKGDEGGGSILPIICEGNEFGSDRLLGVCGAADGRKRISDKLIQTDLHLTVADVIGDHSSSVTESRGSEGGDDPLGDWAAPEEISSRNGNDHRGGEATPSSSLSSIVLRSGVTTILSSSHDGSDGVASRGFDSVPSGGLDSPQHPYPRSPFCESLLGGHHFTNHAHNNVVSNNKSRPRTRFSFVGGQSEPAGFEHTEGIAPPPTGGSLLSTGATPVLSESQNSSNGDSSCLSYYRPSSPKQEKIRIGLLGGDRRSEHQICRPASSHSSSFDKQKGNRISMAAAQSSHCRHSVIIRYRPSSPSCKLEKH